MYQPLHTTSPETSPELVRTRTTPLSEIMAVYILMILLIVSTMLCPILFLMHHQVIPGGYNRHTYCPDQNTTYCPMLPHNQSCCRYECSSLCETAQVQVSVSVMQRVMTHFGFVSSAVALILLKPTTALSLWPDRIFKVAWHSRPLAIVCWILYTWLEINIL